jgi:hypothetical protein
MSKRTKSVDHIVMLNGGGFRCLHCFTSQPMAFPCAIEVMAAAGKAFEKIHAKCGKPKEERCSFCHSAEHKWFEHVNATCPFADRWPSCGDTGLSSNALYVHFMGGPRYGVGSHDNFFAPLDPDDFGRCHRLLHAPFASEWRSRIAEMGRYPRWTKLAAAWDELKALYIEEFANGAGKEAPRLYTRMQELRT